MRGKTYFEWKNSISLFLTLFHIKGVFGCCYVICYYHGLNFITFSLLNITYKDFTYEGFAKGVVKKIFWWFLPLMHSCCTNKNSLRSNHLACKYYFLSLLLHRSCYFKNMQEYRFSHGLVKIRVIAYFTQCVFIISQYQVYKTRE